MYKPTPTGRKILLMAAADTNGQALYPNRGRSYSALQANGLLDAGYRITEAGRLAVGLPTVVDVPVDNLISSAMPGVSSTMDRTDCYVVVVWPGTHARGDVIAETSDTGARTERWSRVIAGQWYRFSRVTMPDGEIRLSSKRYNGYAGDARFSCAWSLVRGMVIPAAPVVAEPGDQPTRVPGVVSRVGSDGAESTVALAGTHPRGPVSSGADALGVGSVQWDRVINGHWFVFTSITNGDNATCVYVYRADGSPDGYRTIRLPDRRAEPATGIRVAGEDAFDFYAGNVPMRAMKAKWGEQATVEFRDRRHAFTPDGQHTGAVYFITGPNGFDTLRGGVSLVGDAPQWRLSRSEVKLVQAWLGAK